MKKILMLAFILTFFLFGTAQANEEIFFDDFNDGDSVGWSLSTSGYWITENGILHQYKPGADWVYGVIDYEISDQVIETKVNTQGYGGVVIWYQDPSHCIAVIIYPLRRGLNLNEAKEDGSVSLRYVFPTSHDTWYKLRVHANSVTGVVDIFIDDSHIYTYQANTMIRTGKSGVVSGNGGAYFDDFKITKACDGDYDGDGSITKKDLIYKRKDIFGQAAQEALEEFNYWKDHCWMPAEEN